MAFLPDLASHKLGKLRAPKGIRVRRRIISALNGKAERGPVRQRLCQGLNLGDLRRLQLAAARGEFLIRKLFPAAPELMGLLALMLLQHARSAARFSPDGELILLDDQDRGLWNHDAIAQGLALIDKAMRHRDPGPYQVQAAIAALHARAAKPADTDWAGIDALYGALEIMQPSPVITLNRAVAVSKTKGPDAALAMIEPLAEPLAGYFHFHGLRGGLLKQLGREREAREAFGQAIALANTPAEAAHIRQHLDALSRDEAEA